MNYAFYVDLGDLTYETWYSMYTAPDALEKRAGWWGPEDVAKSGENSAMIFAQISDEEKLTEHMAFVRKMSVENCSHISPREVNPHKLNRASLL